MDPVKIAGVAKRPTLDSKKEVQFFLGFTNFYHRFIEGFSHLAHPLFNLTWNDSKWCWGESERSTFKAIQNCGVSAPILMFSDDTRLF
jgi:hypothetical protein